MEKIFFGAKARMGKQFPIGTKGEWIELKVYSGHQAPFFAFLGERGTRLIVVVLDFFAFMRAS